MQQKTSRTVFLDLLRIFACFFVIVNHTCGDLFLLDTPDNPIWFVSVAYFFLATTAVPVFFMISGYLLLGKQDSWRKTFQRIGRILAVLMGCAVVYGVYNVLKDAASLSLPAIVKNIIEEIVKVYLRSPSNALWYLYAYLGMLVMMPFLQKLSGAMQKRDYHFFFLFAGIFISVAPILRHYSSYLTINPYFQLPLFSGYVTMLFIGQYFARFGTARSGKRLAIAMLTLTGAIALCVAATYGEYLRDPANYLYFEDVTLLPIALASVSVFCIFSWTSIPHRAAPVISEVGACTFGIYLISDLVIDALSPAYAAAYAAPFPFAAVVVYEIGLFLCGLALTVLLRKIPGIRKFL